jgi:polyisoprenoid-binding protein YceI
VWQQRSIERSGFEISLPVNDLVVDDPEARKQAGADFPPDVPQADRDGTRKNMLRAEVLDGEHFAAITLKSVGIRGSLPEVTAVARITIKDVSHDVELPVSVHVEGNQLKADGMFDIRQTDFGIKPFSIGLGALEVQDRLHVEFHLVAEHAEGAH